MQAIEYKLHCRRKLVLVRFGEPHVPLRKLTQSFDLVQLIKVAVQRHVVCNLDLVSGFEPADDLAVFRILVLF